MPGMLLELWREHTAYPLPPQACLINWYEPQARMGLHQDKDERAFDAIERYIERQYEATRNAVASGHIDDL